MYETNSEVHRHKHNLQTPVAIVTVLQKGVHCDGIKLGNKIQCLTIKKKHFKITMKSSISVKELLLLGND
jgi:hypothetical protein